MRIISSPRPLRKPPARGRSNSDPMSWALDLLWPIATQAAQSYAMIWIENQLKDHLQMGPDDIRRNRTRAATSLRGARPVPLSRDDHGELS